MTATWLTVVAIAAFWVSGAAGFYLEMFPSVKWRAPEDTDHNLTLSLRLNESEVERVLACPPDDVLEVVALHDLGWRLTWKNRVAKFSPQEAVTEANKTVTFTGFYWGGTHVGLFLSRNDLKLTPEHPPEDINNPRKPWDNLDIASWDADDTLRELNLTENLTLLNDIRITVDRDQTGKIMEAVLIAIGAFLIFFNNMNMGAQLDLRVIFAVLRRPLGPACGFLSQFVFMPVSTYTMGYLFFTSKLYRLGLFTLGCCPGGMMSNFWTIMFNGDINLSITMTAVSTISAMAMMPLWMFTLGYELTMGEEIHVPYTNLIISLVSLTVPVAIGLGIRACRPAWADKGKKIIKPYTMGIIIFYLSFWVYTSYKVIGMMTWQMGVAGFLVASLGFGFGAFFARLCCLKKKQIIAICIETAFQNGGVAYILLKLSLPSPESDLAALPAMAAAIQISPPMIFFYGIYRGLQKFCGCCPLDEEEEKREEGGEGDGGEGEEKQEEEKVPLSEKEKSEQEKEESKKGDEGKRDSNIFRRSFVQETSARFGLLLEGMTKRKLGGNLRESNVV